jgi:hypothetical protein
MTAAQSKINIRCNAALTFMGPCIVNIFQYTSSKMQLHTFQRNEAILMSKRHRKPPFTKKDYLYGR